MEDNECTYAIYKDAFRTQSVKSAFHISYIYHARSQHMTYFKNYAQ